MLRNIPWVWEGAGHYNLPVEGVKILPSVLFNTWYPVLCSKRLSITGAHISGSGDIAVFLVGHEM